MTLREHMTVIDPEFQAKADATPPGMFAWAGSGPPDCVCFGCAHFDRADKPRKSGLSQRCERWAAWYRGAYATILAPYITIPPQTPACSAYVPRSERQPPKEEPEQKQEVLLGDSDDEMTGDAA